MPETKEISVVTTVSVVGSDISIFTQFKSSVLSYALFFISELIGTINSVLFNEGELGYTGLDNPNLSAYINDLGELVVVDLTTNGYYINSNGELIWLSAVQYPVVDLDGNVYTTAIIGSQEWIIENWRCTKYADGSNIPFVPESSDDWFLPSRDELVEIYNELFKHGIGYSGFYWSSSEHSASMAYDHRFYESPTTPGAYFKNNDGGGFYLSHHVWPCRSFISSDEYSLRDIGPVGGWIFIKIDNLDSTYTYYEAYNRPSNFGINSFWSNITGVVLGTTGTAIGTGAANTAAIIGQVGHTDSAAKVSDDLSTIDWSADTEGSYCWYNNKIINKNTYGALYNWYAVRGFTDWYEPSQDELMVLYNELHLHGVGGFQGIIYRSSTEGDDVGAFGWNFGANVGGNYFKYLQYSTRPVRNFNSTAVYSLRDMGPSGGWIFHIVDLGSGNFTYYEAAPNDTITAPYSNISNIAIGITAQGTAIGTGAANTAAIIAQSGHISSGALICSTTQRNRLIYLTRNGVHDPSWRVPTDADWSDLTASAGGRYVAGGRLKATGTAYWNSPNTGATDEYGFKGLPAGYRSWNGTFGSIKYLLLLWSSTEFSTDRAMTRWMDNYDVVIRREEHLKGFGFSVRAVRDL